MNNLIAQQEIPIGDPITGIGDIGTSADAPNLFADLLSMFIGIISVVAFIYFAFLLLTGAIAIMSAGGDKGRLEAARSRITTGFIGVIVVIAGIFILDLFAKLLGISGIRDLAQTINNLAP